MTPYRPNLLKFDFSPFELADELSPGLLFADAEQAQAMQISEHLIPHRLDIVRDTYCLSVTRLELAALQQALQGYLGQVVNYWYLK
jgi:hypothetical protein